MGVESSIRRRNQRVVKPPLADARFVSGSEQDGTTLAVKRERNAPDAAIGVKAQLFHVDIARSLEGVDGRTAKGRAELFEQLDAREQGILHCVRQVLKFSGKRRIQSHDPRHMHTID